jgi:hypothetical protein
MAGDDPFGVGRPVAGGLGQHDRRAIEIEAVRFRLVLDLEDRNALPSAIQRPPFHAGTLGQAEQGGAQGREDRNLAAETVLFTRIDEGDRARFARLRIHDADARAHGHDLVPDFGRGHEFGAFQLVDQKIHEHAAAPRLVEIRQRPEPLVVVLVT